MEKMNFESKDIKAENIKKIEEIFPSCITEIKNQDGNLSKVIDFEALKQILSGNLAEGIERYEFTWPGKNESILEGNRPIKKTLRPCKEESKNWDRTENLYIEGDNLDALKLLQESYLGKVKMIYIDPPYNTGSDFIYDDDFKEDRDDYVEDTDQVDDEGNRLFKNTETNGRFHSDWCSMIYPRLMLARNLLSEAGVIFISIDDNELYNLKKCCDEIFNSSNFIGTLSVENNPKGRKNSAFISVSSEYCLIYAKHKENTYFIENIPKKSSDMKLDEDGKYVHGSGKRVLVGENSFNNIVTNKKSDKNYSVYYRQLDRKFELKQEEFGEEDTSLINEGFKKYYSFRNEKLVENTYTMSRFNELIRDGALEIANDKIYEKNFSDTVRVKSQLVNRKYEAIVRGKKEMYSMELTTTGAGTYLKQLFNTNEVIFSAPKNVGFLKLLISLFEKDDFIVLDFFSGSATTADAVMQLNAEDGGNRKFIMVQLPEEIDEKSAAYKAGYKNICEIGKKRIRRAGEKILEDNKDKDGIQNLDIGFRVLKVDSTNMKDVYYKPDEYSQGFLDEMVSNIKEDRTDLDLLFACLLEWGLPLTKSYDLEEIHGKKIHNYDRGALVACFEENINEEIVKEIAKKEAEIVVFRDSSFNTSADKINVEEIFKELSPDTSIKIM